MQAQFTEAEIAAKRNEPVGTPAPLVVQHAGGKIDIDARTVRHVISTSRLDRGGRVVDVNGWKLGDFKKAPRVLADHKYSIEGVIGTAMDTMVEGESLMSTTRFAEEGLGAVAFGLVTAGLVNTWSVGWRGIEAHWAVNDEASEDCAVCEAMRKKKIATMWTRHFLSQELLEYSLVAIPANPDARNAHAASHDSLRDLSNPVYALQCAGVVRKADADAWFAAFGEPGDAEREEAAPPIVIQRSPELLRAINSTSRNLARANVAKRAAQRARRP